MTLLMIIGDYSINYYQLSLYDRIESVFIIH